MTTVVGKQGIKATIIADSINEAGNRITTFELEYPRIVHSELMTHRLFTRNAASSRAIPIMKKLKMVWDNPAMPVHWGKNQSGMQAAVELTGVRRWIGQHGWTLASKVACASAYVLYKAGVHKQITNRIVEPFERFKVVVSATEYDNWFWLRDHPDAQPEIQELARVMRAAMEDSDPVFLRVEDWHLPYVMTEVGNDGVVRYFIEKLDVEGEHVLLEELDVETAKKVSASCCAQVSYRSLNTGVGIAMSIFKKLVESEPVHASPFEHQATPMLIGGIDVQTGRVQEGVTHFDVNGNVWSGNFKGWIQHRQLIPDNAYWGEAA